MSYGLKSKTGGWPAQSVEQTTGDLGVVGLNPASGVEIKNKI